MTEFSGGRNIAMKVPPHHDRVISVTTQLRRNRRGEQVSRWLCQLIQGADVADFTPGHTVFGRGDVVVRACPARRE
jgi:hypothetical protein